METSPDMLTLNNVSADGPLRPTQGLLKAHHRGACWLARQIRIDSCTLSQTDRLRGQREFKYPFLALSSETLTKNARHVLSQKTIAGTMKVLPPYVPNPDR